MPTTCSLAMHCYQCVGILTGLTHTFYNITILRAYFPVLCDNLNLYDGCARIDDNFSTKHKCLSKQNRRCTTCRILKDTTTKHETCLCCEVFVQAFRCVLKYNIMVPKRIHNGKVTFMLTNVALPHMSLIR